MHRILLAAGLLALWSAASAATLVDIATDDTDMINGEDSEPSIAVDPSNPLNISVVAFSSLLGGWTTGNNALVWQSAAGGASWQPHALIPPPAAGRSGPEDQKIAYDSSGNLFVAVLVTNTQNQQKEAYIYRTEGPSSTTLTVGARYGINGQPDQPHLDVDKVPGSHCLGTLYSPWLDRGVQPHQSNVAWSSDQGQHMNNVAVGVTTCGNQSCDNATTRIALAPDGTAYVVYKQRQGLIPGTAPGLESAAFVVQRSDNCGRSWDALGNSPVTVHPTDTVQTFFATDWGAGRNQARAEASDAWIAVDPSGGDVYVAHVSVDDSTFGQIYVARSTDKGTTWAETRVTDFTRHSAYPEIAVANNGTIGVLYIDYIVPPGKLDVSFRHRFARSFDKGLHWTDQTLQEMDPLMPMLQVGNEKTKVVLWSDLAHPFDPPLWGDYEGLTAVGTTFSGVFTGAAYPPMRTQAQPDPIFFTEAATGPATLRVKKIVVPGNDPSRFDLKVDGTVRFPGAQNNGTMAIVLESGTHTVSESPVSSEYSTRFQGACAPSGMVTLVPGDDKTCTVVNFHGSGAFLTVQTILQPASDFGRFDISVDGALLLPSAGNGDSTGEIPLPPGTHSVEEEPDANTDGSLYRTSFQGACAPDGTVRLAPGDHKTCTITNRTCQPRTCQRGFHWCGCDEGCQRFCF